MPVFLLALSVLCLLVEGANIMFANHSFNVVNLTPAAILFVGFAITAEMHYLVKRLRSAP